MNSVTLYYRNGASDKVYQAAVEPSGNLFIVTYAFGRRGSTLQTGTKTPEPVDRTTAEGIFEKLIQEKKSKGYTPGESGTPFERTEHAGAFTGILPQLLNSIDEAEVFCLLQNAYWCLQEKKDGRRLLIRKDGATIQGINRRGLAVDVSRPVADTLRCIQSSFILDGECVGETFFAFDVLDLNRREVRETPYQNRLGVLNGLLENYTNEHVSIVETIRDEMQKIAAFKGHRECRAEGVVLKNLRAPYAPGRPNTGGPALKYKFTATGSFIVAGHNKTRSISLKLFREKKICGNVTVPPNHSLPKVGAIVEVRYLYAFPGGSLYQPVFVGVRDDIDPVDCLVTQLKLKREEADDDGE